MDAIEKAKAALANAGKVGQPQEYVEEVDKDVVEPGMSAGDMGIVDTSGDKKDVMLSGDAVEMTVNDFLSAPTARQQYVDKLWKSKNRIIKIKKFTKGETDRISSPLMQKSVAIEISDDKDTKNKKTPKLDVSMETFIEMEKIMVELGMSYYKQNGKQVIDRAYIDKVLVEDEFKELSALVQEVNPNAMSATATSKNESLKK